MKTPVIVTVVLTLLSAASVSYAYEIETHDELSKKTTECSVMVKDAFMKGIGWASLTESDANFKFDRELLTPGASGSRPHTTKELIGWGAEFEDEASLTRPVNHFFNPLTSEGSSVPSASPSPDWVLEDKGVNFLQKFSFMDANQMLFEASSLANKNERKLKWGEFFQTLGMVLHHIQDMSQPQHVRLDNHCDGKIKGVACFGLHNPSRYEKYINDNWDSILGNFNCSSYPQLDLRFFSTARDFWLTDDGNGRGMAEFTNRNFVSDGTNFRSSWFTNKILPNINFPNPDPQNDGAGQKITKVNAQDIGALPQGIGLSGELWFIETQVKDNYLGTVVPNTRSSSFSIWYDKLESYKIDPFDLDEEIAKRKFNLNTLNFKAAYPFLFRRTLAYGAGLINYFFRGRLEIKKVVYVAGVSLAFTVKNNTSKKNPGNAAFSFAMGNGKEFMLYADDSAGNRSLLKTISLTEDFVDKATIDVTVALSTANNIDINKPFTLVYDGKIGNPMIPDQTKWERGIAVKTFTPQRLLAFDVSRTDGSAPVPNIIDIYQSLDTGKSWQKVSGRPVAVNDTTPDPRDHLGVNAVTYIGNGNLLLYPDYLNYGPPSPGSSFISVIPQRLEEFGGQSVSAIPLDWKTLFAGNGNNTSDLSATLRSLTYTGKNSLTALRLKYPLPSDPVPRSRQFQFVNVANWDNRPSVWTVSTNAVWANGGLPELSWQGGNSFATSVYVEKKESADPNTLNFDSAIRRTSDHGASYSTLTNFDECVRISKPDVTCIQRITPMDNNRLLGWVSQNGEDYFAKDKRGEVKLYHSLDNGANWSKYGIVPLPQSCAGPVSDRRYLTVDNLLYLGTKKLTTGIEDDTLFVELTCRKMILVNGNYSGFEEVGKKVSVTTDSGATWTEVVNPPHENGRIIFAGDNGVVPDLYE